MAPVLTPLLKRAFAAVSAASAVPSATIDGGATDGPLADATRMLAARDTTASSSSKRPDPASGVLDPHDISNVGFFVLFALLGLAFVVGGIWFFFWARNGGFYFKQTDWEDYKTGITGFPNPIPELYPSTYVACKEALAYYGGKEFVIIKQAKTTVTEDGKVEYNIPEGCAPLSLLPQCTKINDLPEGSMSSHQYAATTRCYEDVSSIDWPKYHAF
ncbi:hypothetical protein NLG97_g9824 [Lecanicillium saksenae]|uniref:Uncharacterized protein n=1 Tax=Lecanicillium saksenae TaxID=468837 RepID=A0ACC1QEX3_9HYPO|nr:hypothetical protein NLG97_g9824 [Lecanicillium saksenae]